MRVVACLPQIQRADRPAPRPPSRPQGLRGDPRGGAWRVLRPASPVATWPPSRQAGDRDARTGGGNGTEPLALTLAGAQAQVRPGELVALAVRGTFGWTTMAVRRPQLATWALLLLLVEGAVLTAVFRTWWAGPALLGLTVLVATAVLLCGLLTARAGWSGRVLLLEDGPPGPGVPHRHLQDRCRQPHSTRTPRPRRVSVSRCAETRSIFPS